MTIDEAVKQAAEQHRSGNSQIAEQICSQLIQAIPNCAPALHLLAMINIDADRPAKAIELMKQAVAADPGNPKHYDGLGRILFRQGNLPGAIEEYRKALKINPDLPEALVNFGVALSELGDPASALECFKHGMRVNPHLPESYANMALVLVAIGKYEEGLATSRKALQLMPDSPDAHWNHANLLLSLGHFEEGWPEMEWRLSIPRFRVARAFPQQRWNGEDISQKTILLHAEGGQGDTMLFARYVPLVAQRNATVVLECQPLLLPLLKGIDGASVVLARGDSLPPFQWRVPLPSLPLIFNTTLGTIPARVPYLPSLPEQARRWADRMAEDRAFKVGLAWAGKPRHPEYRSRSLSIFGPLGRVANVGFYSLQKGPEASEPPPPGIRFNNCQELGDFSDTAGLIANLDLVISVDTVVAHLAGAMGKPVWTLIPRSTYFIWLRDREDSPWYPTMRLFRQIKNDDWSDPVLNMAQQLQSLIARKNDAN